MLMHAVETGHKNGPNFSPTGQAKTAITAREPARRGALPKKRPLSIRGLDSLAAQKRLFN